MDIFALQQKVLVGFGLAAPIGPVSVEMLRRGLKSGFWSAYIIRIGAVAGNALCLLLACYGLSAFLKNTVLLNIVGLSSSLLLIYLGVKTMTSAQININNLDSGSNKNGLLLGFYLSVANPVAIMFWTGIFAKDFSPDIPLLQNFIQNTPILLGILVYGAGFSFLSAAGNQLFGIKIIDLISKLLGVVLCFFGLIYSYKIIIKFIA